MSQDEKPLAPELRFLLDAERSRPDAPADAKSAAQERLAALLGPAAGLGGGGSGGHGSSGSASSAAAASAVRGSPALTIAKFAGVFALGGLVVGGLTSTLMHPQDHAGNGVQAPAVSGSVAGVANQESAAVNEERPLPSAPTPSLEHSAPSPAPSASAAAPSRDTQLAAERALLERARTALAHGDGSGAFAAIHEHEQKFARGQLSEEREVLAVQALAIVGRSAEAAERAAHFRQAFPHSLLLPVVEQALH
jgi:hypothetical protein